MPGRQRPGEIRGTKPRTHQLTDQQRALLRVALKALKVRHGGWGPLADALKVAERTLKGIAYGSDFGSMILAEKVAALAGAPLLAFLEAKITSADRCPECGQLLPRTDG